MNDLISKITSTKPAEKPVENIGEPVKDIPVDKMPIPPTPAETPETVIVSPEDLLTGFVGIQTEPIGSTPAEPATEPGDGEVKRGRGRPKGSKNKPSFEDIQAATKPAVDYNLMANMTFDMSAGILANVLGPEWLPKPPVKEGLPGERDVVVASLKTYFESKQIQDLPPGLMLTVVLSSYALPRFREPTTSNKLKMTWLWVKAKVGGFFAKKRKVTITPVETTTA